MTFLPIVERELRVAARKRGTYWSRVSAALTGLVIGGGIVLLNLLPAATPFAPGQALFTTLTWLALAAALAAGLFFTADCLSREKREGTLGFLFLTDLRGYDVVGGKLLATSLRMTYGLMAIIPVLAPRNWQEKPRQPRVSRLSCGWRYGGRRRRLRLQRELLGRNPVMWLACRERWQSAGVWLVALLAAGTLGLLWFYWTLAEFWMALDRATRPLGQSPAHLQPVLPPPLPVPRPLAVPPRI